MDYQQGLTINSDGAIVLRKSSILLDNNGTITPDFYPSHKLGGILVSDGTLTIYPSGGDDTLQLQSANDQLRDMGGGYINLICAKYKLNSTLILDCGSGVGIRGNGAIIDATGISTAIPAITLSSRHPNINLIPNADSDSVNYHGKRVEIEGFSLVGVNNGTQVSHGIDINMSSSVSTRSPRPTVRNVTIEGFDRQIRHRNFAYLVTFMNGICNNGKKALSIEGGNDQGEQTNFICWTFGNSDTGLYI